MLKVDEHILELAKKKKIDKEYLKLVNDTSNKIYASLTYSKIAELAIKLKEYHYALSMYNEAIKCKYNVSSDLYYFLGNVYLTGTFNKDETKNVFMKPNANKAIEVYKKIKDKEESRKLRGYIYYYGLGKSKKKYSKAFKLFKKMENTPIELGHLYFYGKGTFKNRYEALKIYSSFKFNKDEEISNNFIEAMKKVELFKESNNKEIDLEISNMYLKVLTHKKKHDLMYDFVEYLFSLNNEKEYKKLITKYYKEYLKITEKIGNKDLTKYLKAYEYVTPVNKRDSFEYKVMKAELGDESYYFEVGLAYAQGYLMDINKEKANKYLGKHLSYLEHNLNNDENLKNYIYLCELLNKDLDKNIHYLEAKAKQNNMEYILKVGLAYLYGNIVNKDINKAKLYLNKYLKSLEPYINEENKSKLGSYISIYESVYGPNERNDFVYHLAKAIMNDPYYKFLVGIAYEEGIKVNKDLTKAKRYIKEAYEGGFKGAYNKYQEYFNPNSNKTSYSTSNSKIDECLKILSLDKTKDITLDIIKSQFRKLSKIYHPDLCEPKYKDGKKFIELNDAYNYLNQNFNNIKK